MNEKEFRTIFLYLGIKFTDIDNRYNLPRGTTRLAIGMPNKKGESALSEVLDKPLKILFPNRYDENNNRLRPQPTYHYSSITYDNESSFDIQIFSKTELNQVKSNFFKNNLTKVSVG